MKDWYYILNEKPEGPLSQDDLSHVFASGALPISTPVWRQGLLDWAEARTVSEFKGCGEGLPDNRLPTPGAKRTNFLTTVRLWASGHRRAVSAGTIMLTTLILVVAWRLWCFANPPSVSDSGPIAGYESTSIVSPVAVGTNLPSVTPTSIDSRPISFAAADPRALGKVDSSLLPLSFSKLWADTETYVDRCFVFHGALRLPRDHQRFLNEGLEHRYGGGSYRQVVLTSLKAGLENTEDLILCYVHIGIGQQLVELLGENESTMPTGYFLLRIPAVFSEEPNGYKFARGLGTQRVVMCEMLAYGPNMKALSELEDDK